MIMSELVLLLLSQFYTGVPRYIDDCLLDMENWLVIFVISFGILVNIFVFQYYIFYIVEIL